MSGQNDDKFERGRRTDEKTSVQSTRDKRPSSDHRGSASPHNSSSPVTRYDPLRAANARSRTNSPKSSSSPVSTTSVSPSPGSRDGESPARQQGHSPTRSGPQRPAATKVQAASKSHVSTGTSTHRPPRPGRRETPEQEEERLKRRQAIQISRRLEREPDYQPTWAEWKIYDGFMTPRTAADKKRQADRRAAGDPSVPARTAGDEAEHQRVGRGVAVRDFVYRPRSRSGQW